jgi:hypothetical protein
LHLSLDPGSHVLSDPTVYFVDVVRFLQAPAWCCRLLCSVRRVCHFATVSRRSRITGTTGCAPITHDSGEGSNSFGHPAIIRRRFGVLVRTAFVQ